MQNRTSAALAASLTTADLVDTLLAELSVGDPIRAGGLSIFPLTARDPLREPATRVVTVGEALERAWLTLRISHEDSGEAAFRASPWAPVTRSVTGAQRSAAPGHPGPCRVLLQSWADAAILITAGEELPGCGGLVAVRDVLVPPGARGLGIPVTPGLAAAGAGDERSWQHRVRALETIASGFPSGCEGVLVAVGDRAFRLELFPSAWLLSRARPDVLRAAAFEALAGPDRPSMSLEDAERFLRELPDLEWARRDPVGLGFEVQGSGPGVSAGALFLGGALVHLSADARGGRLLLAAPNPTREPASELTHP
jgi:hypothetical protein